VHHRLEDHELLHVVTTCKRTETALLSGLPPTISKLAHLTAIQTVVCAPISQGSGSYLPVPGPPCSSHLI
jgi:hypothetical protein